MITEDINFDKMVHEQLRLFRKARKPLLEALDVRFLIALETDDATEKAAVIAEKQTLRDVTEYDFSALESVDDIYTTWPSCLGDISVREALLDEER